MNTYSKYCANTFLAKCPEKHDKGSVIILETKYWKENSHIVHNLIYEKDWHYFYSITREDWFNSQEYAKNKSEKLSTTQDNLTKKSDKYWEASQEGKDFLSLAEPIKIWHHSEKRHRALIKRNWDRTSKAIELDNKAKDYDNRISYREDKSTDINLSMPESLEYFEYKLEKEKIRNKGLKDGTIPRDHWYTLTYSTNKVKELQKSFNLAVKLRS